MTLRPERYLTVPAMHPANWTVGAPPNNALLSPALHGWPLFHACGVPSFDAITLELTAEPCCESWHSQILKDIVIRVQADATLSSENKNLAFDRITYLCTRRTGSVPIARVWVGLMFTLSAVILFCAHVTPAFFAIMLAAGVVLVA
jgi:hypothetical protein